MVSNFRHHELARRRGHGFEEGFFSIMGPDGRWKLVCLNACCSAGFGGNEGCVCRGVMIEFPSIYLRPKMDASVQHTVQNKVAFLSAAIHFFLLISNLFLTCEAEFPPPLALPVEGFQLKAFQLFGPRQLACRKEGGGWNRKGIALNEMKDLSCPCPLSLLPFVIVTTNFLFSPPPSFPGYKRALTSKALCTR